MAKFKVVLESAGVRNECVHEYESLEEAQAVESLMVEGANRLCEREGVPGGKVVSIEEVSNGNES